METQEFDLEGFRKHLQELEHHLSSGIKQDSEYQGEVDEIIASLKRLSKELKDEKYQQVLPDLFSVLDFLDMIENNFDDEDEEFDDEDEEFDDEEFDDEEFDDEELEDEELEDEKS